MIDAISKNTTCKGINLSARTRSVGFLHRLAVVHAALHAHMAQRTFLLLIRTKRCIAKVALGECAWRHTELTDMNGKLGLEQGEGRNGLIAKMQSVLDRDSSIVNYRGLTRRDHTRA